MLTTRASCPAGAGRVAGPGRRVDLRGDAGHPGAQAGEAENAGPAVPDQQRTAEPECGEYPAGAYQRHRTEAHSQPVAEDPADRHRTGERGVRDRREPGRAVQVVA